MIKEDKLGITLEECQLKIDSILGDNNYKVVSKRKELVGDKLKLFRFKDKEIYIVDDVKNFILGSLDERCIYNKLRNRKIEFSNKMVDNSGYCCYETEEMFYLLGDNWVSFGKNSTGVAYKLEQTKVEVKNDFEREILEEVNKTKEDESVKRFDINEILKEQEYKRRLNLENKYKPNTKVSDKNKIWFKGALEKKGFEVGIKDGDRLYIRNNALNNVEYLIKDIEVSLFMHKLNKSKRLKKEINSKGDNKLILELDKGKGLVEFYNISGVKEVKKFKEDDAVVKEDKINKDNHLIIKYQNKCDELFGEGVIKVLEIYSKPSKMKNVNRDTKYLKFKIKGTDDIFERNLNYVCSNKEKIKNLIKKNVSVDNMSRYQTKADDYFGKDEIKVLDVYKRKSEKSGRYYKYIKFKVKNSGEVEEHNYGNLFDKNRKLCHIKRLGLGEEYKNIKVVKDDSDSIQTKNKLKTDEQFVKEVYNLVGKEYVFLEDYVNKDTPIMVMHNVEHCGHKYYVSPNNFLKGIEDAKDKPRRCPNCNGNKSIAEVEIDEYLNKSNILYLSEYSGGCRNPKTGKDLRYDFAIFNLKNKLVGLIEHDSPYHFNRNNNDDVVYRDNYKNRYAKDELKVDLLRIPFYEDNHIEQVSEFCNKVLSEDSDNIKKEDENNVSIKISKDTKKVGILERVSNKIKKLIWL